ncbi:MAG: CpsD/CapB family tyrosine-protein kinase [Ilumatobacteraceae bacterium]|nr:CpsD/CapB family tyrosine-protein kinase [Ilumatobacteraceae bacterium]
MTSSSTSRKGKRLQPARDEADQHSPAKRNTTPPPAGRPVDVIAYDDIPAELAEAVRAIINRHELRTGEPLPRSIAVTSATPGDGVTTVSQTLASLIAQETGAVVCWFDCSWLAPQPDGLDMSEQPDLMEILEDRSRIVPALRSVPDLPQLLCLAPRPVPEHRRNSIVRAPEFEAMLELLIDEFDHVIFDVPAILDQANGLALLRRCDAALFVVRHRSTSVGQVERALTAIQPTPILGVVLNRFKPSVPAFLRRQLGG